MVEMKKAEKKQKVFSSLLLGHYGTTSAEFSPIENSAALVELVSLFLF